MMSTEMATTSALASAGAGPQIAQTMNATAAMSEHGEHEPARDLVCQLLNGRARSRGVAHHLHDAREQRIRPDALGAHQERAGLVHGAAGDLGARSLSPPVSARRSASTRRHWKRLR